MDVLATVVAFLGVLVILVVVHELGHFLVAKWAGITVEEFGIGFPPRIASFRWRGTRYSLNAVPLGGFVKMLGENGDNPDERMNVIERMRRQGSSPDEIERALAGSFNRKPMPVRLAVLVAGVIMNFLLAVALIAAAVSMPQPVPVGPLTVMSVQPGSPAEGRLEVDDVILAADGRTFERSHELTDYVKERAGRAVELTVRRDGSTLTVTVTPRVLTPEQEANREGPIGFGWQPADVIDGPPAVEGPLDALGYSLGEATRISASIPGGLARAVGGLLGLAPNTGDARGPIGIAQITGEVLDSRLATQLGFVAVLSLNLAVLNVLPFPPLDGGRIAVTLIEALRRRRLPPEREALIYLTGFAVLIALVILISIQDIQRLFGA